MRQYISCFLEMAAEIYSILPVISEIFEQLMITQLITFFESILSKFQCGFWKGFSIQHFLRLLLANERKLSTIIKNLLPYSEIWIWLLKSRFTNWEMAFLWHFPSFIRATCGFCKEETKKSKLNHVIVLGMTLKMGSFKVLVILVIIF